jgi:protein-disulfide isomerase
MAKKKNKTPLATQSHKERLRQQQEEARRKAARIRRAVVGSALALAVVLVIVFVFVAIGQGEKNALMDSVVPPDANAEKTAIQVAPGKAKADAPKVVSYFDYQCSGCIELENVIGTQLFALANNGDIDLQLHPMTFRDSQAGENQASTRATVASACADYAGGNEIYQKYHQGVFANSTGDGFSDDLLRSTIASTATLSGDQLTQFEQCYDERLTQGFVGTLTDAAFKNGVTGTPAISVNGKVYSGNELQSIASGDLLTWFTAHA